MISLPILDLSPQRPSYSQGPRSLRAVRLLRLSVTDRCNLRCIYCMPEDAIDWMAPQEDLLRPADYEAIVRAALELGIEHIKITGGEPTVRRDLLEIVGRIHDLGPTDLSLTTNALRLDRLAAPLREAGVDRLTVSCDSLRPERFAEITRGGDLARFWRGVDAAQEAGFTRLKLNVVVMAGINDDEVADFAALTLQRDWTVRFIEYMPLGDSVLTARGAEATIVDNDLIKARITERLGPLHQVDRQSEAGVGPAEVFRLDGAIGRLGFISAMSRPFCETCNRLRLTALGELRSCLFDGGEVSVMEALRPTPDLAAIKAAFARCVSLKPETHSGHGNRAMSQLGG